MATFLSNLATDVELSRILFTQIRSLPVGAVLFRGVPKGIYYLYPQNCHEKREDIFLTDMIGYDRLKLYLKIYAPKNEILGTPLILF